MRENGKRSWQSAFPGLKSWLTRVLIMFGCNCLSGGARKPLRPRPPVTEFPLHHQMLSPSRRGMRPTRSAWRSGCRRTRSYAQLVTDLLSCSPRTLMRQMLLSEGGDMASDQRCGCSQQVLAPLRNFSHLPKSVWSLGYCRLAFLTLSSSHFDPQRRFLGLFFSLPLNIRQQTRSSQRFRHTSHSGLARDQLDCWSC